MFPFASLKDAAWKNSAVLILKSSLPSLLFQPLKIFAGIVLAPLLIFKIFI